MLNSTINTAHGQAIVIGFERFDSKGMSAPHATEFKGTERIVCKLLPGHSWPCEGDYCLYPSEYMKLNTVVHYEETRQEKRARLQSTGDFAPSAT